LTKTKNNPQGGKGLKKPIFCFDCEKKLQKGDEFIEYPINDTEGTDYIKCKECHQKDPVLRNFRPCEVYSRCVGYYRPVSAWNPGKAAEFSDRVTYKV